MSKSGIAFDCWRDFFLDFQLAILETCAWVLVRQVVKIATGSHVNF